MDALSLLPGYMDAFFQLGMLHLRWANSDHSEVEGLQKRHRKLVAETQQHQKEAMQRQQQQRHRERAHGGDVTGLPTRQDPAEAWFPTLTRSRNTDEESPG